MKTVLVVLAMTLCTLNVYAQDLQPGFFDLTFSNGRTELAEVTRVTDNSVAFITPKGGATVPRTAVSSFSPVQPAEANVRLSQIMLDAGDEARAIDYLTTAWTHRPNVELPDSIRSLAQKAVRDSQRAHAQRRHEAIDQIRTTLAGPAPENAFKLINQALVRWENDTEILALGVDAERTAHRISLQSQADFRSDYAERLRQIEPSHPLLSFLDYESTQLQTMRRAESSKLDALDLLIQSEQESNAYNEYRRFRAASQREQREIIQAERTSYLRAKNKLNPHRGLLSMTAPRLTGSAAISSELSSLNGTLSKIGMELQTMNVYR